MPPPGNETPRRKNGFVRPYTGAQLSTWIALPVLIAEFIVVVTPVLPLEAAIPCTVVLGITAALAAYYAFMAQLIDPMDEYLAKHLAQQENGQEPEDNGFGGCLGTVGDEVEPMKHCWICETQVAENAMHCKFCNKCVGNFDHHCMWLNTCIGKKNYQYFLLTMVYIAAMLLVHCSVQIALIIDIFLGGSSEERANEWFDSASSEAVAGVYIGFVAFDAIALSLIFQLIHFHMILRKEGLTTYKYIVRETQKKREKINQDQARKTQRMVATGKANDEGKKFLALRLRYGEVCKCCDPLPPPEEKNDDEENPQQINGTSSSQAPVYKSINGQTSDSDEDPDTAANGNGNATNGNTAGDDVQNGSSNEVIFEKVASG